jgi:hypothetical protein
MHGGSCINKSCGCFLLFHHSDSVDFFAINAFTVNTDAIVVMFLSP